MASLHSWMELFLGLTTSRNCESLYLIQYSHRKCWLFFLYTNLFLFVFTPRHKAGFVIPITDFIFSPKPSLYVLFVSVSWSTTTLPRLTKAGCMVYVCYVFYGSARMLWASSAQTPGSFAKSWRNCEWLFFFFLVVFFFLLQFKIFCLR